MNRLKHIPHTSKSWSPEPFPNMFTFLTIIWKILQDSLRNYSFHSSTSPSALKKETLLQMTGLEDDVHEFS